MAPGLAASREQIRDVFRVFWENLLESPCLIRHVALDHEEPLMATGPKGQKRPADVIGNAVNVMQIRHRPGGRGIRRQARGRRSPCRAGAQGQGNSRQEHGAGVPGGDR